MSGMFPALSTVPEVELLDPNDIEVEISADDIIEEVMADADQIVRDTLPHSANLAMALDEREAPKLALHIIEMYDSDKRTRMDWEKDYRENLRLLGLKVETRTVPWDKACGVMHPLITEALIRFQATTIMEMFPISGPFRAVVQGPGSEALTDAANRLKVEFNWIATKEMPEFRTEVEQGLWRLGLAGIVFRKVWNDPVKKRAIAETIPAEDVVVPFSASHIYSSPRISHLMRKDKNEVEKLIGSGWWAEVDLPDPQTIATETETEEGEQVGITYNFEMDGRYEIVEMQVDLDLPGFEHKDEFGVEDGLPLPYVVTVEKQNLKILSIRRNWREGDPTFTRLRHINAMCYIPGWGFYGIGLLTLLAGLTTGATSLLRQVIDAGTLSNLPFGFKGQGLRVKNDGTPLRPGEFRDVEMFSGKIADNIMQMTFKGPDVALISLMGSLIEEGRRLGAIAELPTKTGEMPVGTIVAMIEHQTRPQSAVQARIHVAFGEELDMIVEVVRSTGRQYRAPGNQGFDMQADLRLPILMLPVSDPNASTSAVRILQAQAAVEMSAKNPTMYDQPFIHRTMLKAMGVGDVDSMLPDKNNIPPADPISENMSLLNTKPVKAGVDQDHKAHIRAHMALVQDPRMAAIIGQNPQAAQIQAALAAHLAEHAAFLHRSEIIRMLGFPVPMGPMPPEIEQRIAPLVADAAMKAAEAGKAIADEQQGEEQMKDPVIQAQMMELMLKKQAQDQEHERGMEDLRLKAKKMGADIARDAEKVKIDRARAGAEMVGKAGGALPDMGQHGGTA